MKTKKIIIKINNKEICTSKLRNAISKTVELHDRGNRVLIIASGAIDIGCSDLGFKENDVINTPKKQAAASIGQSKLTYIYTQEFNKLESEEQKYPIAQILITKNVITDSDKYTNLKNTINSLFKFKIIPIISENYAVSTDNNSKLSIIINRVVKADLILDLSKYNDYKIFKGI